MRYFDCRQHPGGRQVCTQGIDTSVYCGERDPGTSGRWVTHNILLGRFSSTGKVLYCNEDLAINLEQSVDHRLAELRDRLTRDGFATTIEVLYLVETIELMRRQR